MNLMIRPLHSSRISCALLAGIFLVVMLACSGLSGTPSVPTLEPETFGYCGAHLSQLCVISFGRDAFGDTVVNLFVPRMRYPAFYLNIVQRTGADVYECIWSKIDETSVYCTGRALNLDEGVEIQILSKLDDRILARGTFTVSAFLVTTPRVEEALTTEESGLESGMSGSETETPEPTQETETPSLTDEPLEDETPEETPEPTSSTSYPNYP